MPDTAEYLSSELPALLRVLQESDVVELELQEGDMRIRMHRTGGVASFALDGAAEEYSSEPASLPLSIPITAPLVGTFYRAGKPSMAPLVTQGSRVESNTVVGIMEALQVLTEVEAGCQGTVTEVLATDGQAVEYGQTLFEVRPGG